MSQFHQENTSSVQSVQSCILQLHTLLQAGNTLSVTPQEAATLQRLVRNLAPASPIPSTSATQLATPPPSRSQSLNSSPISSPETSSVPQSRVVFPSVGSIVDRPSKSEQKKSINRQTTVDVYYEYEDPEAYIEYPETSSEGVAYKIRRNTSNWTSPTEDFAYSLTGHGGESSRTNKLDRTQKSQFYHALLGDGEVPCRIEHWKCDGMKVCPHAHTDDITHTKVTPEMWKAQLDECNGDLDVYDNPSRMTMVKTSSWLTAVRRLGCRARLDGSPDLEAHTAFTEDQATLHERHENLKRGYQDKIPRCGGRIVFAWDLDQKPTVRLTPDSCEHYDSRNARTHYHERLDESYRAEYIEAVLSGNNEAALEIEKDAATRLNAGPLATCNWMENPYAHRQDNGDLYQPLMVLKPCKVTFRTFEPLEEYRQQHPYIILVVKGIHKHPIPMPKKTPPRLRSKLFEIFKSIGVDLADLTARSFIRHTATQSLLHQVFPENPLASISDLHPSLANHSHIAWYIEKAKKESYPKGTGWEGAKYLFQLQKETFPADSQYIRKIIEVKNANLPSDEHDNGEDLRIIVTMTKEGARRLQKSNLLQADIAFKRIPGWKEFEMVARNRPSNTVNVFGRVYMTRETTTAHFLVFQAIEEIVRQDTGKPIYWRHLYAKSNDEKDQDGLMWMFVADQHLGQAKGLAMHLQSIAQTLDGYDLFEPHRRLRDLSLYDHLHRIFRLCRVHFRQNIKECAVPKDVKHWLENKIQSKFALEAICWEKSKIPEYIWCAGDSNDNVVEGAHSDVNLEGKGCTLVGGIEKGRAYDARKQADLLTFETSHIRHTYASGLPVDNATRGIKRKQLADESVLRRQDDDIRKYNNKLDEKHEKFIKAKETGMKLWQKKRQILESGTDKELKEVEDKIQKTKKRYEKLMAELDELNGKELPRGSGMVQVKRTRRE
ncbi:hypothetical protein VNI00_016162 [Paramarasmius palmivorus]|uniref:Uncharacterized protein n=1 Tax=Paramarasmius palmivorus TaxID=297713 RepID=A0AAW0BEG2_9AGAR